MTPPVPAIPREGRGSLSTSVPPGCVMFLLELVPKLSGVVPGFVDFAIRPLWYQAGVVTRVQAQRSRGHDPGFEKRLGSCTVSSYRISLP